MKVEIRCAGARSVALSDLEEFQGNLKDLSKENYEKLKSELLELGFSEPVSVWRYENRWLLLNGHQRVRTLRAMKAEGVDVPAEIPVSVVEASNIKEARKKVLSLTSQYGEITKDGLYEFMNDSDLNMGDLENFRFPEIDLDDFNDEFFTSQEELAATANGKLAEMFGAPPFSILDTRQGYWQERKRAWLSLAIPSELGRGGGASSELQKPTTIGAIPANQKELLNKKKGRYA
jgi:hypothetical protein